MLSVADTPLGADARAGVGYARDIEDRQSVAGSIEFGLPIFRRGHELAALRAELAADEADLREAERLSWLDAERFHTRADTARAQLELATQSARAAQHAREIAERALAEGEASRTEVADARAAEGEARARAAERRVELAEALANLESRLADTDTSTTAPASPKETTR
jgi:outer membrane protein TolC